MISSDVDTTVSKTDYAYDRIFVAGDLFEKCEQGKPFKFDEEYSMTREDAFRVSDHYPIEFDVL